MQLKQDRTIIAATVALLIALVMLACWYLWAPAPPKQETYKPAVHQVDGSVILERRPDPTAKPKQLIPTSARVERVVSVTVRPSLQPSTCPIYAKPAPSPAPVGEDGSQAAIAVPEAEIEVASTEGCAPVTVDMTLIREADGGRRVVASSPDGEILGGADIPVEAAAPPPAPKLWAVGAVADPFRRTVGAFIDRDIAFVRVGIQVNQRDQGDLPNQVWLKVGIRF